MTIDLSKEDIEQIEKDGYLSVCIEDNGFCAVSVSAEYIKIVAGMRTDSGKLAKIEQICKDAFSDPETLDINLYRAQALANIYHLFIYDEK